MNWLKQNWVKLGLGILILVVALFWADSRNVQDSNSLIAIQSPEETKATEENILNLTEEEIYSNPFIKHIRVALNGYLDGSNKGIEDDFVINGLKDSDDDPKCGLAKFDKSYYKSKFIVWHSVPNEYGGRWADIVFLDRPDAIFIAWIYQYADEEYILRSFCEGGQKDDKWKAGFAELIKAAIKENKFRHSL